MTATWSTSPGPAQAGLVASAVTVFADGITAIDTDYVRPRLDASHLIVEGGRAAFVDTGTSLAVPRLLAVLEAQGVAPESVDWVFLTHIHLDHAGGAGALLEHLPNARAVVHPRGARHLAEPAQLIAATCAVYGDALYDSLYGEIRPIATERLVVTEDGTRLDLAGRPFRFLHTPGHALHHHVIHDEAVGVVYSGDTFGISYREFDVAGRAFILPTTTPTQFDPDQLRVSIDRILALAPRAVFLTHYSRVTEVERLGADLHAGVSAFVDMAHLHGRDPERVRRLEDAMYAWLSSGLDRHGYDGDQALRKTLLGPDIELNVQGLIAWLDRAA